VRKETVASAGRGSTDVLHILLCNARKTGWLREAHRLESTGVVHVGQHATEGHIVGPQRDRLIAYLACEAHAFIH